MAKSQSVAAKDEKHPDVDRGYAWVVLVAVFMNHVIVDGIMFSFGIFKIEFVDFFGETDARTTMIGSTLSATTLITAPLASVLVNKFGCRVVCMCGGAISTLGFSLSYFCSSINQLLITYGLIAGFGLGLMYLPSVVAVTFYFEKRRAFATGIAVCGTGVGCFIFAPTGELLLRLLDWKNGVVYVAMITIQGCIFGALLRPIDLTNYSNKNAGNQQSSPEKTQEEEKLSAIKESPATKHLFPPTGDSGRRSSNYSRKSSIYSSASNPYGSASEMRTARRPSALLYPILPASAAAAPESDEGTVEEVSQPLATVAETRVLETAEEFKRKETTLQRVIRISGAYLLTDPFFVIPVLCNLIGCIGLFVPFFYIVDLAYSRDIEKSKAAFLLSVIGITNTLGRIIFGFLADLKFMSALALHNAGLIGAGLMCILSMLAYNYVMFCSFAIFFGFFYAGWIALTSVVLCELVGLQKLTNAFGILTLARGTATLIGPPIAGHVYDLTQEYSNAMHVGGSALIVGGLIACILHLPYFQWRKASGDPDCVYCCPYPSIDDPTANSAGTDKDSD